MATINHKTYNEGTETFKDFSVYDGKDTLILKVDGSSANVGIGTSSPSGKLHVAGGDIFLGASYALKFNSTSFITPENNVSGAEISTAGVFVVKTGVTPTEQMRITATGSVGIGTSAPTQKLTVNGNAAVGGQQAFWLRDDDGFSGNAARRAWAITANYATIGTFSIYGASAANSDPLAGTPFLNITSAGVLDLNQGQIKFPATQVPSADANTLDDYEEGTFTPTVSYSTSGTPIYATQSGVYTKIGRSVQVQMVLSWNENGAVGNITIQGLPFASVGTHRAIPSILSFGLTGLPTAVSVTGIIFGSSTAISLFLDDNAGTTLTEAYTDNDQDLYVTVTYQAA